ncbi:MAG: methyltetrahydrofolate cobalamin methyltransferase [Chloroflexi bacterium]|nr:methyltetrahydrofolate cobalamin methyltransferase [Chloroflexota bacterium]
MIIVGELINTSRKPILESVARRDAEYIASIARRQAEAGASYLDVNCSSILDKEAEVMAWLVENIQKAVDIPLCIDTPNPAAMAAGISLARKGRPLANSITGEKDRFAAMLPLLLQYHARVTGLCTDDQGIPETAADRLRVARDLVHRLTDAGIDIDDIYLDPVLTSLSTNNTAGVEVLTAIRLIKEEFPKVHLICGLSNVSYGLPSRKVLNQAFMIQTMAAGMDAYILDPLDRTMMGFLYASQALLGQDQYCRNYLSAYRRGLYNEEQRQQK